MAIGSRFLGRILSLLVVFATVSFGQIDPLQPVLVMHTQALVGYTPSPYMGGVYQYQGGEWYTSYTTYGRPCWVPIAGYEPYGLETGRMNTEYIWPVYYPIDYSTAGLRYLFGGR